MNLALVEGDQINMAVVGDASIDEIHVAERGRGHGRPGTAIAASSPPLS